MPTLRALECLVAVIEAGSVTEAAQRLHASQPAVSHQLATLEQELGVALLQRLPRGVAVTTAGRAVLADARRALLAAQQVRRIGRAVAAGRAGELRIGCAASLVVTVLPPTLRRWHRLHPDIELTVVEADSADELAGAVQSGDLDLAVTPSPGSFPGTATVIGTEELLLALPRDHPLAVHETVSVALLDGEPLVAYHPRHGLSGWLDGLLVRHAAQPRIVMRTRQTIGAAQLAAAGLGLAIVPAGAVPPGFTGAVRRLDPPQDREIVALTLGDRDVPAQRFVADLVRHGVRVAGVTRQA